MIFGFLVKFRIDIQKNPHKNKKIQDKKMLSKNRDFFFETKNFPKKSFEKAMKNQHFDISIFFPEKIEISKFWFFIDFSKDFFRKIFGLEKYFFDFFDNIFWSWKFLFVCGFFCMSIRNFIRNQKVILRKSCDHSKDTKNRKTFFFLLNQRYRPPQSWGSDILCIPVLI